MEVIGTKKLHLVPVGNVSFSFKKRKDKLYIGEIDIKHETLVNITPEVEKALHKLMKAEKSELLTDGNYFYTTTGESITQIAHPTFYPLLSEAKKNKAFLESIFGE
jgi:hypothetical protein